MRLQRGAAAGAPASEARGSAKVRGNVRAMLLFAVGCVALGTLARCGAPVRVEPAPPVARSDVFPSEAAPSLISMPVALPVDLLLRLLDEAVPLAHGTETAPVDLGLQGRTSAQIALRRGPLRATFEGHEARVETTIRYGLRFSYALPVLPDVSGSCGIGNARQPGLEVTLRSPVTLDRDWLLRTQVQVASVRPASLTEVDRCEVTALGVDVTDRVVEGARAYLQEHLAGIDGRAARVDTRSRFERWWSVLREPIELSDSVWLSIGPEAIRRGPVTGSGDSIHVELGLRASPRITLGARPRASAVSLPPLDSGAIAPRLDLLVDARADYGTIGALLTERLSGRHVEVRGLDLRIDSLGALGIGAGMMALQVHVSGDLKGGLFFTGTPTLDARRERVSVPDLELDVASERLLSGLVPSLFAVRLRDVLRQEASWPLDPAMRWLEDWLRVGLNRDVSDGLRVTGIVHSVDVVGLYPLRNALLVRLSAGGSASLVVRE